LETYTIPEAFVKKHTSKGKYRSWDSKKDNYNLVLNEGNIIKYNDDGLNSNKNENLPVLSGVLKKID